MVRAAQRNRRDRNRDGLTMPLPSESATSLPSTSASSANVDTVEEIETTDQHGSRSIEQSNVWNFATKVSLEKARCNICQIGKYVHLLVECLHF